MSTQPKLLRGVITKWSIFRGRVKGELVFSDSADRESFDIITSDIISISAPRAGDIRWLETRNSYYILIGDPA